MLRFILILSRQKPDSPHCQPINAHLFSILPRNDVPAEMRNYVRTEFGITERQNDSRYLM
jgi:hypothetical protein